MNPRQNAMYWAEWAKLRDVLRAGGKTHVQIEDYRRNLTIRALGRAKSSKDFTNADLDKVLARIWAEREPGNFDAQMRLQDSPDKRRAAAWNACDRACWDLYEAGSHPQFAREETRTAYIAGIARKVLKKELRDCTAEDLRIVHGILDQQRSRARKAMQAEIERAKAGTRAAEARKYLDAEATDAAPMPPVELPMDEQEEEDPF